MALTINHKKMKSIRILCWALLTIGLVSCNKFKDFGDVNVDPTKSSSVDPAAQLAYVQARFSGDVSTQQYINTLILQPMMQQTGGAYATRLGFLYERNAAGMNALWDNGYPNDVVNIVDATLRSGLTKATKPNLHAMCRVMKVYVFARMTDIYGDIPYFEAGKAYAEGIIRPKYDAQQAIYADFLKELTEASAEFTTNSEVLNKDLFYGGNITLWKKFTNSLKLRLALRLAKRDPEKAKTAILEAVTAGVFTSNSDICMTKHEDVQSTGTDIRGNGPSVAVTRQSQYPLLCQTLYNQLKNTNDPRFNSIVRVYRAGQPSVRVDITDQIKASANGLSATPPNKFIYDDRLPYGPYLSPVTITIGTTTASIGNNEQRTQFGNFLIRYNAPFFHITYAEVELLLADAIMRFPGIGITGTDAEHYNKGVTAAMKQLSLFPGGPVITDAEISTFLGGNALAAGTELDQINTQLWINYIQNGPELFANWRRTGFPALVPAIRAESTATTIPRRFEYPLSEKEQNTTNVNAAIANIKEGLYPATDNWENRVWWDKQ
jgi:hypothetical protein